MDHEIFDAGNGYFLLLLNGSWFYWRSGLDSWMPYPVDSGSGQATPNNMSFLQWAKDHGTITQRPTTPASYIKGRNVHGGWDIARLPQGTPIHAFRGGTVIETTYPPSGWGNSVVLQDKAGNKHRYAHFREQIMARGQVATKGQVIGYMGKTGKVFGKTGIHLHYEVITPSGKLLLTEQEYDSIPS